MSGTINLGRVRPIYKGNYNAETAYSVLERVKYKGHIYECVANTIPGIAPDSADNGSAYWTQISVNNAIPQPVWTGTELAFEYPDGTITDAVDLEGPQGPQGVPGPINLTSDLTSTAADVALTALGGNTLANRIALLQTIIKQGLGFNTREIIAESGEWTAPVTGTYRITLIGGGGGAYADTRGSSIIVQNGFAGERKTFYIDLEKDQTVPVTIGAGGVGEKDKDATDARSGGNTTFGNFSTSVGISATIPHSAFGFPKQEGEFYKLGGAGPGGGYPYESATSVNARSYGGGAACTIIYQSTKVTFAGNGYQGCVIVEYFDLEKASFPTINDADLLPYLNLVQRLEAIEAQLNMNS